MPTKHRELDLVIFRASDTALAPGSTPKRPNSVLISTTTSRFTLDNVAASDKSVMFLALSTETVVFMVRAREHNLEILDFETILLAIKISVNPC